MRLTDQEAFEALLDEYSDTFKELYGVRPKGDMAYLRTLTLDQLYQAVQELHGIEPEEHQCQNCGDWTSKRFCNCEPWE